MSITDISAERMAQTPARPFGVRRVAPMPVRPRPAPFPSAAWQAARGSLSAALARLPGLWRLGAQGLTWVSVLLVQGMQSLASAAKPSESRSRQAAVQALLRSDASSTFVRLLAYVSALALLALTAAYVARSVPVTVADDPAPAAEWLNVAKPFPAFSLPMSEFADSGSEYAMRRHLSGGGRQDILRWGELEGAAPHLMVEIYRPAGELTRFDSAAREIAARLDGVEAGSVKPAGKMETKFGTVSLVEFSIKPARQCLGFVRAYDNPTLQILGWHCAGGAEPAGHDLAACALDRLTLLAAGSEPKVRELFARAELKRNFCGQRSHLFTPTPRLGPAPTPPKTGRAALP